MHPLPRQIVSGLFQHGRGGSGLLADLIVAAYFLAVSDGVGYRQGNPSVEVSAVLAGSAGVEFRRECRCGTEPMTTERVETVETDVQVAPMPSGLQAVEVGHPIPGGAVALERAELRYAPQLRHKASVAPKALQPV